MRPTALPLLLALLCASGCTAHLGGAAGRGALAHLRADRALARTVYLERVDARPLGWLHDRAALRPGAHRVTATLRALVAGREVRDTRSLEFVAEPGRSYVVSGGWGELGAHLWIRELASGATVAHAAPRAPRLPPVATGR